MLIKKNRQLKPGDFVVIKINMYGLTDPIEKPMYVAEVYDHYVLFKDSDNRKRTEQNYDLVKMGIYSRDDVYKSCIPGSLEEATMWGSIENEKRQP